MDGLKIGHFTNSEAGTGVSVFLFENAAVGAYVLCGSAPASHELAVLDPENAVPYLHGLAFVGGSAYGLTAVAGVMTYLTERGIGHPTRAGNVPIVPAAGIYDLAYKRPVPPTAEQAYQACLVAKQDNTESGRIGAGTGARVGKIIPRARPMSGGLGHATVTLHNGVTVTAYVIVNAAGDVVNASGQIIAGACDEAGKFANCERFLLSGHPIERPSQISRPHPYPHSNSTLAMVVTNAALSKSELKRIGKMAVAGMARAVVPIFTQYDGDIVFCVSVGECDAYELTIGTMAAEAVKVAILDAVKNSEILSEI